MSDVAIRDDQIVSLYLEGQTLKQLAKTYGISHERVRQMLHRQGIKLRPRGRQSVFRIKPGFGRLTNKERFKRYLFYTHDDHWIWEGPMIGRYGRFQVKKRTWYAHQAAYLIFKGKEPINRMTRKCDQPLCVNPGHWRHGFKSEKVQ
jgi:hypothetical protein